MGHTVTIVSVFRYAPTIIELPNSTKMSIIRKAIKG
jgi:hypothetical protein